MGSNDDTQPLLSADNTAATALPGYPTRIERPARVGTVVWGFILIGVAAIFFAGAQLDLGRFNPAVVAVWSVLGIGVLAVAGGVVGALTRRK